MASFGKWLSVRLQTKWLWFRIPLQSLKLQVRRLLQARSSLTFRQAIKCRFTLKPVRDIIITNSQSQLTLNSMYFLFNNMHCYFFSIFLCCDCL